MGNIVKVFFGGNRFCKTRPLTQYDYGQVYEFMDITLPDTFEIYYSNAQTGPAKKAIGQNQRVTIYDEFLTTGAPLWAWVFLHTGANDGETKLTINSSVIPRGKDSDAPPTPVQQDAIDQAIAALNDGVERAETAAESAEQSVANVQETVDAALQEAKDSGEFDGKDGVSPEITVTAITNGHRITVTDVNGPHTFDVMDGRGIVSVTKTGTSGLVDTYTITYTDGTTSTFTITNGEDGAPGVGVPSGGTQGQILAKKTSTDYDTEWQDAPSPDSIFVATYNVTTYNECKAAFDAGKQLVCKYTESGRTVISALYAYASNTFRFSVRGWDNNLQCHYFNCDSHGWEHGSAPYNAIADNGTIEAGDLLTFVNVNSANRINKAYTIPFGTDADKYLANDGTWQSVPQGFNPSNVAPVESDAIADHAYVVGDWFMYEGTLHKATDAISEGGAIEVGVNCAEINIDANVVKDVQVNGTSIVQDGVANVPVTIIDDTAGIGDTDKAWSADKLASDFSEMPTEETGQELLRQENYNTGLTDTVLNVIGAIFDGLPQDEILQDIRDSIALECDRLEMIYNGWISEREGS